jgi:hypothetical protein
MIVIKINVKRDLESGDVKKHIVHRKVTLNEPCDGTGFTKRIVSVSYEVLPQSEAMTLSTEGNTQFLEAVVVGWGDPRTGSGNFGDEDGNKLDFNNKDHRAATYDTPWIGAGLVSEYFRFAYGNALLKGN